jgi:hypothetical protein
VAALNCLVSLVPFSNESFSARPVVIRQRNTGLLRLAIIGGKGRADKALKETEGAGAGSGKFDLVTR